MCTCLGVHMSGCTCHGSQYVHVPGCAHAMAPSMGTCLVCTCCGSWYVHVFGCAHAMAPKYVHVSGCAHAIRVCACAWVHTCHGSQYVHVFVCAQAMAPLWRSRQLVRVRSSALWTLGTELSLSGAFCTLVPSSWPLVFFF